jgi:hypothetical protein
MFGYAADVSRKAFTPVSGGTASGQITGSASGIQRLSLNVTGVSGVTFSQEFNAADLSTATPVPGSTSRLLSGSKTATDGSLRTLTILDTASSSLGYIVLGGWEYAATASTTNTTGASFVLGPGTRPNEIPVTGTATYSGLMVGKYADGAALWRVSASASALADFADRRVDFTTTNTQLANQAGTQGAPDLNLGGTLIYAAGTNRLTGLLSTPGGAMTGPAEARFYGPAAAELGGGFFVSNSANKQMVGSFGLKQ